jgi:hypothetical protein
VLIARVIIPPAAMDVSIRAKSLRFMGMSVGGWGNVLRRNYRLALAGPKPSFTGDRHCNFQQKGADFYFQNHETMINR